MRNFEHEEQIIKSQYRKRWSGLQVCIAIYIPKNKNISVTIPQAVVGVAGQGVELIVDEEDTCEKSQYRKRWSGLQVFTYCNSDRVQV